MKAEKKKLLIPKTDIVFQALFGRKGNERILEGLLTEILENKVENVSLDTNQVLIREIPEDKLGILDLRANVGESISVNIELQLINTYNIPERILYYWSRIYGSQIKSGEDYNLLKKTISILIIDFELEELEKFKDAHTVWKLLEKRDMNAKVFKNMEIHIIEIPKWLKNKKETREGLGKWIEFLENPESEMVKMEASKNIRLKEACKMLEYISENEQIRREIEFRRKLILDERNRNRVLSEIENGLKEKQKKIEEQRNKIEEQRNKIEEQRNKVEEEKDKVENEQKKIKEKQNELYEKEKDIDKKERNIEKEKKKLNEDKQNIVQKLLKKGMTIEEITEITTFNKEEIFKIINKK